MSRDIEYMVKYSKLADIGIDQIATRRDLRRLSASKGMICEVAAEFLIISNYRMEPVIMARRYSYG